MNYRDYLISYTIYDNSGKVIKSSRMKVKNKLNEMDAKVKLEVYLKSKNKMMDRLVIHSCSEDNIFNEIFGNFDSNPFVNF